MSVEPNQYTGPREFVATHVHSLSSSLDGVPSAEQYADVCLQYGHPAMAATEHGHMASVPDMYFAFKKRGLKYIAGCFLPGQRILTKNAVCNIEDIIPGTEAYTHKGRFSAIKNLQTKNFDGDVVKIKAWGVEDQVSTPEHLFLVREVTRAEVSKGVWEETIVVDWKEACDIERKKYCKTYNSKRSRDRSNKRRYKHYLCVPRLPLNLEINYIDITNLAFLDGAKLEIEDGIVSSVRYEREGYKSSFNVGLPIELPITDELLWIMGLWLAEGSLKPDGGLEFSLGGDEEHFVEQIKEYFEQFDINTNSRRRDGVTELNPRFSIDVTVHSSFFARIFKSLFGSGAANKIIPTEWLWQLSPTQSEALLNGLFDGDAKIGKRNSYLKLCNETLVWQSRLLMTKLIIPQHSAVTILVNENSERFGTEHITTTNNSYTIRRRDNGHFYYDYDDKYIYLPVYETSIEHYVGSVYNLEVEGDNSYYIGVAVHNCEIYFNNYEPLRQEMEARGEKIKAQDEALRQRIVKNRHLTVLAKNATGFSNLLKLTTLAWKWGFYYKPRTWFEKLCEYKEGLIVLSGCMNGPLSHEIRLDIEQLLIDKKPYPRVEGRDFTAAQYLKKFKEAFGEDFFIEVQMPCLPELHDIRVFWKLIELADKYNVRSILSNDSHYLKREDAYLQKIMMAIEQGTTVYDPNLFYINSEEQYFKTRAELWATFKNNGYANHVDDAKFEEICDNTLLVAERCEKLSPDTSPKIPSWSTVEPGVNPESKLRNVVYAELKRRGWDKDKTKWFSDGRMVTYVEQTEIELNRFIDKGFASYFLITWDLMSWGKSQGQVFGPRGSVGGSLVCFLLGIHCLNSLRWGLSMDRFMASSRGGYLLKVDMGDR